MGRQGYIARTGGRMMKRVYQLALLALLWGPPLFRSRFSDRTATSSMRGDVDAAAMVEVAVWLTVGLLVYLTLIGGAVVRRWAFSPTLLRGASGAFFVFVALELLSVVYAPSPSYAGFRAIQVSIALLLVAIMTSDGHAEAGGYDALRMLFLFCGANVAYTAVMAILQPDLVFSGKMLRRLIGGGYFRPDYGLSSMVVIVWQGWRVVHRKRFWWLSGVAVLVAGTVLVMGRTRTTIIATSVALLVVILSRRGRFARGSVLLVLVGVALISLFMWETIVDSEQAQYLARNESLSTFSGRLDVWPLVLAKWWDGPFLQKIFGYGYVTGTRSLLVDMHHKGFGNTHNALLEVLLGIGLLGVTVAVIMMWRAVKQIHQLVFGDVPQHLRAAAAQASALVAGVLVGGVAGLGFANAQYIDVMIFIVGVVVGSDALARVAWAHREQPAAPARAEVLSPRNGLLVPRH